VFYTDGATDLPPPHALDNAEFISMVEQATGKAATAEEVADRLHDALDSVLSFDDRNDDVALLIMRIADTA
jgi:serine phosphatase RsbU (regulator of sigma subunit)